MSGIKNVLVIDDNEDITQSLTRYLQIKKIKTTTANTGLSGLNLLEHQKFDIVLLDLSIPDLTGIDIIKSLEKNDKLSQQKIIILTATSITNNEITELLKKPGIIACVRKPISLKKLLQLIINDKTTK